MFSLRWTWIFVMEMEFFIFIMKLSFGISKRHSMNKNLTFFASFRHADKAIQFNRKSCTTAERLRFNRLISCVKWELCKANRHLRSAVSASMRFFCAWHNQNNCQFGSFNSVPDVYIAFWKMARRKIISLLCTLHWKGCDWILIKL